MSDYRTDLERLDAAEQTARDLEAAEAKIAELEVKVVQLLHVIKELYSKSGYGLKD